MAPMPFPTRTGSISKTAPTQSPDPVRNVLRRIGLDAMVEPWQDGTEGFSHNGGVVIGEAAGLRKTAGRRKAAAPVVTLRPLTHSVLPWLDHGIHAVPHPHGQHLKEPPPHTPPNPAAQRETSAAARLPVRASATPRPISGPSLKPWPEQALSSQPDLPSGSLTKRSSAETV